MPIDLPTQLLCQLAAAPFGHGTMHDRRKRIDAFIGDQNVEAAELAHTLGLGVNAGHDLDLANLTVFRELPFLDEVSIGHAIMSRALYVGLSSVVHEYLALLGGASGGAI